MAERWLQTLALGWVAFGGASVAVPLYVLSIGGDTGSLGMLVGAAAIAGGPALWLLDRLPDRPREFRGVAIVGLAVVTLMLVIVSVSRSIAVVIIANTVVWVVFAALLPLFALFAMADAPDAQWPERIERLTAYQGTGWLLGLLVGAVWSTGATALLGPRATQRGLLLAYACCAGLSCLGIRRALSPNPIPGETPAPQPSQRSIRRATRLTVPGATVPWAPPLVDPRTLRLRRLVSRATAELALYFVAIGLVVAGSAAAFAPLPVVLAGFGYGPGAIFVCYLLSSLAAASVVDRVHALAATDDVQFVQMAGVFVRAVALPLIALFGSQLGTTATGLAWTAVLFVTLGVTWSVIVITAEALFARLVTPSVREEGLAAYCLLVAFAGGAGSIAGGRLAAVDHALACVVAGLVVFAGGGIVVLLWHRTTTASDLERTVICPGRLR